MRARTILALAGTALGAAALRWRRNPSACPYGQRFWIQVPHPIISRARLYRVLGPQRGERLGEIGVGTGNHSLQLAEWVGPGGRLELFDLQQEFLDHTMRAAVRGGLSNLIPSQGDATALPYAAGSIDGVILTALAGEIPDSLAALGEIRRVLKPSGRLVIGELFGDPHFTTSASLKRKAAAAGLAAGVRSGNWFGYFARLARVEG
jgi:ubiquinone/menaquinone biosynthesis C-methylase UbiE